MNTLHRRYSPLDRLLIATQKLASLPAPSNLTLEAETPPEFEQQLSATERHKSAALMRVNHAGEIAAHGALRRPVHHRRTRLGAAATQ